MWGIDIVFKTSLKVPTTEFYFSATTATTFFRKPL